MSSSSASAGKSQNPPPKSPFSAVCGGLKGFPCFCDFCERNKPALEALSKEACFEDFSNEPQEEDLVSKFYFENVNQIFGEEMQIVDEESSSQYKTEFPSLFDKPQDLVSEFDFENVKQFMDEESSSQYITEFPCLIEDDKDNPQDLVIPTPKILVGTTFKDYQDGFNTVAKKLWRFGSVVSLSFVGVAPNLKMAVEYSKVCEAEAACSFFFGSQHTYFEPKSMVSCEETIKVSFFRGSLMRLFKFLVSNLDPDILLKKIYLSPEEDFTQFVDFGKGSNCQCIADFLGRLVPCGFSVERPHYSPMLIDPVKLLLGGETRVHVILENIPLRFDPDQFRTEVTMRLWESRFVFLENMITSFRMPYNSEMKLNEGFAEMKFKTTEFLHVFFEEFHGKKPFSCSEMKQYKRLRLSFMRYPNCF